MTEIPNPASVWALSFAITALGMALSVVDSLFAIATIPLCSTLSDALFDLLSRRAFRRSYVAPLKLFLRGSKRYRTSWSDHFLFPSHLFIFFAMWMFFCNAGDCLAGQDHWPKLWALCQHR
jgi:hypothetical protein